MIQTSWPPGDAATQKVQPALARAGVAAMSSATTIRVAVKRMTTGSRLLPAISASAGARKRGVAPTGADLSRLR